ncbi:MAG: agmatinase [Mycobacterium sp.]
MTDTNATDGGAPDAPANISPPDGLVVPRFAGPDTYARLPRLEDVRHADLAVMGVPFDSGVSYRPGARFGPAAVRQASKLVRPYNPSQDVTLWPQFQLADAGDAAVNPFNIEEAVRDIESAAERVLSLADRMVVIGGDHTIALPLLRTAARRHGPIALIHFDAHIDTWNSYFGAQYTHGTPFRRAHEEGLIDADHSFHVGIRGPLYGVQDLIDDRTMGFATVSTDDIALKGIPAAIDKILERVKGRPVYVSLDIDVLDPAHAPGTGTPEAGGLTTREVFQILRALIDVPIVGADVVEVAPAYDHAELTALAASSVVFELLSLMARQR